jgi:uncharacterized Zn finger protein
MYGEWPAYVPVAKRRAKAAKTMEKLRKKGMNIQPVTIQGRTITKQFWGKQWCAHIETFSDFESRLPKGRTYVRNGSVCHLAIERGEVKAIVSGSGLYQVKIQFHCLPRAKWAKIVDQCAGKLGSVLELLQGTLDSNVMSLVTNTEAGLFPEQNELKFSCSCPDWASMCKHIAAVFYGIGHSLDTKPELLFGLRGVNHLDLISASTMATVVKKGQEGKKGKKRKRIQSDQLSSVFGIDIQGQAPIKPVKKQNVALAKSKRNTKKLQQNSVAQILGRAKAIKRTIYKLSDGRWRKVEDLTGSLQRRAQSGAIKRRQKVWYYLLKGGDDAKFWLKYAQDNHS